MKKMVKSILGNLVLAAFCLTMSSTDSFAATTQTDCSNSSAVQTALNNAASGDTVMCSAGGSYTWSSVSIPSGRDITLNGNGATIRGSLVIPSSASSSARVTNFTFRSDDAITTRGDALTNKPWRLDHCTFDASGTSSNAMITTWIGPGLIDHCNFIHLPNFKEVIHNMGYGPSNYTGWTNPSTPGSMNALYLEDNTFDGPSGFPAAGPQNYYGSRVVVRHNTFNNSQIDVHGNHTAYGNRWWEIYNNTFNNGIMCVRGGSGVLFGNGGNSGMAVFIDEPADAFGHPSTYSGVGRGQNQAYDPAYTWSNSQGYLYNRDYCSINDGSGVRVGTDVIQALSGTSLPANCTANPPQGFWKTDTNTLYKCTATNTWTAYYQPLAYPHPLITGSTAPTTPNPPTSLTAN